MEFLLQWGLNLIIFIQQIQGPVLDNIFRTITFMGAEEFYLFLIPLIFWCVDFRMGARLAILLLLSSWVNINLKELFQQPRPFDLDQSVMLALAEGYGLPSGHAQSAAAVWGYIASWGRQTWLWAVAIGLMALIGFSRIYLGVHFPTDVLAGWVIGSILFGVYFTGQPAIGERVMKLNLWTQILLALVLPMVLLLVHPAEDTTSATGAMAGVALGLVLTYRYFPFSVRGSWWHRTMRFIVGITVIFIIYLGLQLVFPGEESVFYLAFRFLRYGLIGLWVSLGAPWLFRKLQLYRS